jgi:hypothetical protein
MVKKILRSWVFWVAVLIGLLGGASFWLPYLGILIALLTVVSAVLQGYENQRTQEDINTKHAQAMSQIQTAQNDISTKHSEAMQEIAQARGEAEKQHTEALQEIKQARDEARAETILLEAKKFATSLMDKDERVNKAVALYPDFKQSEWRQLGHEMSVAVIDGFDRIKQMSLKAARYPFDPPYSESRLDEDIRTFFTDRAIRYLTETVLNPAIPDAQGLLYLACMYGCRNQYDEMMKVLDKASQVSQIVQVMKAEYRERPMMLILVGACGSDQTKIKRLRKTLDLPHTTKTYFCKYAKEFPLKTHQLPASYIEWIAVRKPEVAGESGTFTIKITPPYPSNQEKVDAFFVGSNGIPETTIPVENQVSIEELYGILTSSFMLFCPIG